MNREQRWKPDLTRPEKLTDWAPVVLIVAVCLGLGLGGEEFREWGRYERDALAAGELWRLITAHLVHLGWGHLWLNLIAFILMALLFGDLMTAADWVIAGLLGAACIDIGLYLYHSELGWYVGLSGVLHGLMVIGAFALVRARSPVGHVLLAGVAAKLTWEQFMGPLPFSEATSGGPVLVEAHLYGTIGGVAAVLIQATRRRLR